MNFAAIDVETANANRSSICQIGIARFVDGEIVETWTSLVDPEDTFSEANVAIHGIQQRMVEGQPSLPQVADRLRTLLDGAVTVCHSPFDRVALGRAFEKYGLAPISTSWLDSAHVARHTWKDLASKGYGLANLCRRIGYTFQHHDALEDAKAAGHVLVAALRESQEDIEEWCRRATFPADRPKTSSGARTSWRAPIKMEGNPEGDLHGEVLVFTGELALPRQEAAELAASVGCQVAQSVTKKTTLVVVGDQDATQLAGHDKSSKHRKAEQLVAEGHRIRIIRESDFKILVRAARNEV